MMVALPQIFDLAGVLARAGFGDLAREIVDEAGREVVESDSDEAQVERSRPLSAEEQIDGAISLLQSRFVRSSELMRSAEEIAGELAGRVGGVRFTYGDGDGDGEPGKAELVMDRRSATVVRLAEILERLARLIHAGAENGLTDVA